MTRERLRSYSAPLAIAAIISLISLIALTPSRSAAQGYGGATPTPTASPTATVVATATATPTPEPIVVVVEVEEEVTVDLFPDGFLGEAALVTASSADNTMTTAITIPSAVREGAAGSAVKTLTTGVVSDIAAVIAQAPVAKVAAVVLVASIELKAFDSDGNQTTEDFAEPVTIAMTVDESVIGANTNVEDVTIAFWNGFRWVYVAATVTINADGSYTVVASVNHFTLFSVIRLAPTVFPVSDAGPLTQGISGTYDPARLAAVQAKSVQSMFALLNSEWFSYIPGAPLIVNTLTVDNLLPDTPVFARFVGDGSASAALTAD